MKYNWEFFQMVIRKLLEVLGNRRSLFSFKEHRILTEKNTSCFPTMTIRVNFWYLQSHSHTEVKFSLRVKKKLLVAFNILMTVFGDILNLHISKKPLKQ